MDHYDIRDPEGFAFFPTSTTLGPEGEVGGEFGVVAQLCYLDQHEKMPAHSKTNNLKAKYVIEYVLFPFQYAMYNKTFFLFYDFSS